MRSQHSSIFSWETRDNPGWNFDNCEYRIKDPYAALRGAWEDPTKEVWTAFGLVNNPSFSFPPDCYEIRDKPKATKKVKLLAWFGGRTMFWLLESEPSSPEWIRVPAEDKEITVEVPE